MHTSSHDIKVIFCGTPEFAAAILDSLIASDYKPVAVITALDKPKGRERALTFSPVKDLAQKHNISVLQSEKIQNLAPEISNLNPDLIIVAAFGQIIPKNILDIPRHGSLNIHPSLLPKYRGASPIQAAILSGDRETGVTIMLMDEKMDHGPIVAQRQLEFSILNSQFLKLNRELAKSGAGLLIETLPKWLAGEIKSAPQDHSQATFTKIIQKEDGKIDWHKPAEQIERMTRAYWPWPSAYSRIKNNELRIMKIIKADILKINHQKGPGTIFTTGDKKMAVACGQDGLMIEELQLEGKKKMTAQEFLNGHPEIVNSVFI